MMERRIRELLEAVQAGRLDAAQAYEQLRDLPYADLGFARIDHHRSLRCGFPEVVYCPGKTPDQIRSILNALFEKGSDILATRLASEVWDLLAPDFPALTYHETARALTYRPEPRPGRGQISVLSAGTADLPVAEEARITAEMLGAAVITRYDVGVAGLHRLLDGLEAIRASRAIVVVAGMEGALASVVGGLVDVPIIAVPTSVGYGANFDGLAPLLAMLNSCAAGVSVVNIDNGFGGGYAAALINRQQD